IENDTHPRRGEHISGVVKATLRPATILTSKHQADSYCRVLALRDNLAAYGARLFQKHRRLGSGNWNRISASERTPQDCASAVSSPRKKILRDQTQLRMV